MLRFYLKLPKPSLPPLRFLRNRRDRLLTQGVQTNLQDMKATSQDM
jgi:hypothetical protein